MPHCVQTEQKRTAADKEAERQHQERLMEGFVDDQSVADILEVVDPPLQATPNPNALGGGGTSWANHPRGRGHVSRGGRGGGRRRRKHGRAQFAIGDIPPRFQHKPQNLFKK